MSNRKEALRKYYGLDSNPLDAQEFDVEAYIRSLPQRPYDLIKAYNGLVVETRALDGERKALVYDNYAKLINAAETVKDMSNSVDDLRPSIDNLRVELERMRNIVALVDETFKAKSSLGDRH